MYHRSIHWTDVRGMLYRWLLFMKICWQNPKLFRMVHKIQGSLNEHLSTIHCCRWHQIATKKNSFLVVELYEAGMIAWGGIRFTSKCQDVRTLHVSLCIACSPCIHKQTHCDSANPQYRSSTEYLQIHELRINFLSKEERALIREVWKTNSNFMTPLKYCN